MNTECFFNITQCVLEPRSTTIEYKGLKGTVELCKPHMKITTTIKSPITYCDRKDTTCTASVDTGFASKATWSNEAYPSSSWF